MIEESFNASMRRNSKRERLAVEAAKEMYGSADVEVGRAFERPDDEVEWVDGGYWVNARIWVDFEEVEGRLDE